ncbi:hypothetical protein BJ165DRAFT_1468618, partial [Panaeolus papilionaceus]
MVHFATSLVSLLAFLPYALAGLQCGGKGWTGPTVCPGASWYEVCAYINEGISIASDISREVGR